MRSNTSCKNENEKKNFYIYILVSKDEKKKVQQANSVQTKLKIWLKKINETNHRQSFWTWNCHNKHTHFENNGLVVDLSFFLSPAHNNNKSAVPH